jgi:hypothetical protein
MRFIRRSPALRLALILVLCLVVVLPVAGWAYTRLQLSRAEAKGVYQSPEEGMRSRIEAYYTGIKRVDILYAGTNSFDGSQPHVWYVIAEVRAASRADGSSLGSQDCDAPGHFFLQTKKGWVFVPEGAFPWIVGFWMNVHGMAGPGRSTPSTDWAPEQPARFCTG